MASQNQRKRGLKAKSILQKRIVNVTNIVKSNLVLFSARLQEEGLIEAGRCNPTDRIMNKCEIAKDLYGECMTAVEVNPTKFSTVMDILNEFSLLEEIVLEMTEEGVMNGFMKPTTDKKLSRKEDKHVGKKTKRASQKTTVKVSSKSPSSSSSSSSRKSLARKESGSVLAPSSTLQKRSASQGNLESASKRVHLADNLEDTVETETEPAVGDSDAKICPNTTTHNLASPQPHTDAMPWRKNQTEERIRQLKSKFSKMVTAVAINMSERNIHPEVLVIYIQGLVNNDKALSSLFQSLQNAKTVMQVFMHLTSTPLYWNFENYDIFRYIITEYDDEHKTCMKLLEEYEQQYEEFKNITTLQELVDEICHRPLQDHSDLTYLEIELDSSASLLSLTVVDKKVKILVKGLKYLSFSGGRNKCIILSFHLLPSESKLIQECLSNADAIRSLHDNDIVKVSLDHVTIFSSNKYDCQLVPALSAMQIQRTMTQSLQPSIPTSKKIKLQILARAGVGPRNARMIVKNYPIRRGRFKMFVQEEILCMAIIRTQMMRKQKRRNEEKIPSYSSSLESIRLDHFRSIRRSEYRH